MFLVEKPSLLWHKEEATTYPTNLGDSDTLQWQLGSHQHGHSHTSSDNLAQMCPSTHVNNCQKTIYIYIYISDFVDVSRTTTNTVCVWSLVRWEFGLSSLRCGCDSNLSCV